MLTWHEEMIIPRNIETIWQLFEIDNLHKIMPQVEEMKVLEKKPGVAGSIYEQTYREGKRVKKYIVTDLAHIEKPNYKHNTSGFQLAKLFDIKVSYTLEKISENETKFIYYGENKGLNAMSKILLKLMPKKANQKVVDDFMKRVKEEALRETV